MRRGYASRRYDGYVRQHPRIQKGLKWTGASAAAVLVTVWVASRWWDVSAWCGNVAGLNHVFVVHVWGGIVDINWEPTDPANGGFWDTWVRRYGGPNFFWWFSGRAEWPSGYVWIPLWIPVVASLMVTGLAWRQDRRATSAGRQARCSECGYDRKGISGAAACPECGTAPADAGSAPQGPGDFASKTRLIAGVGQQQTRSSEDA